MPRLADPDIKVVLTLLHSCRNQWTMNGTLDLHGARQVCDAFEIEWDEFILDDLQIFESIMLSKREKK